MCTKFYIRDNETDQWWTGEFWTNAFCCALSYEYSTAAILDAIDLKKNNKNHQNLVVTTDAL
jgi:hypothetical protein